MLARMRVFIVPFLLITVFLVVRPAFAQSRYEIKQGTVKFRSEAPLELIQAESKELKGLIDFADGSFAFTMSMTSFQGFNSALQREHFNENYMESEKFPKATFAGRMIDPPDPQKVGEYTVRAKGKLTIHGVEHERIIQSRMNVATDGISIYAAFTVLLQEHDITIPKVVQQKIAEEISVEIKARATKK